VASLLNWFTAMVALFGVILIVVQVRQAAQAQLRDHDRRRRQATLEFYAETMERRIEWREVLPNDRDAEAVAAFVPVPSDTADPANKLLGDYLNYYELIAIGVNLGILDFETIYRVAGTRLIAAFDNYRGWIEGRREYFGSPALFCELEVLTDQLRENRRANTAA